MAKAVRFDRYGAVDVLYLAEVPRPVSGGRAGARRGAGSRHQPGEAKIRGGELHERRPATFPSGQGSDLAGVVAELLGPGVTAFAVGDEVIGFVNNRSAQAEYVLVEATDLTRRPSEVSWGRGGRVVRRRNDGLRHGPRGRPGRR